MNKNTPELWDFRYTKGLKNYARYCMTVISNEIPADSSVLDIGGGNGKFLRWQKEEKNVKPYVIDISPAAIKMANNWGVPGEVRNAENLDDFQGEFDIVVCTHVMEHIDDDKNLAKNIGRLAKKMALIAVPNDCSYPHPQGLHVRKYNYDTLIEVLKPYFTSFVNLTRPQRFLKNHLIVKCLKQVLTP